MRWLKHFISATIYDFKNRKFDKNICCCGLADYEHEAYENHLFTSAKEYYRPKLFKESDKFK